MSGFNIITLQVGDDRLENGTNVVSFITAKNQTMNKSIFYQQSSKEEINEGKAMGFDLMVEALTKLNTEDSRVLLTLVEDLIPTNDPFKYTPEYIENVLKNGLNVKMVTKQRDE